MSFAKPRRPSDRLPIERKGQVAQRVQSGIAEILEYAANSRYRAVGDRIVREPMGDEVEVDQGGRDELQERDDSGR